MPYSYDHLNDFVNEYVRHHYSKPSIVDLGAGAGKYGKMFRDFASRIDAVEIFRDNIYRFNLRDIYDHAFNYNLMVFERPAGVYDLAIMGDVLEHLSIEDADRSLLKYAVAMQCDVLIVVPFNYPQGPNCPAVQENPHEEHLQPDLTAEVMAERYPTLVPLHVDKISGVYLQKALK